MSLKKQLYKPNVLKKLLNDENSCISLVSATRILALPPFFLNDMKSGVFYLLNNMLKKYDRSLDGIVVGYENIKILIDENTGIIPIGTSETEVNISVDFYIFQPKIHSHLEGVINKKSSNHIGCLVHQYFNATILKPEDVDFDDWICKNLNVDDKIIFKVKDLDFTGLLPYIEGIIDDEKLLEKVECCVNKNNEMEIEQDMDRESVNGINELCGKESRVKLDKSSEKLLTSDEEKHKNKKSSTLGSNVNQNEIEDPFFSELTQKKKKKKNREKESKLLSFDLNEKKCLTETEEIAALPQKRKKKSKKKDNEEEEKSSQTENTTVSKSSKEEVDQCSLILQEIKNKFKKNQMEKQHSNDDVSEKFTKTTDSKNLNSDSLTSPNQSSNTLEEGDKKNKKKKNKSTKKEKETSNEINETKMEEISGKSTNGFLNNGDPSKEDSFNESLMCKEEQKKDKKKKKKKDEDKSHNTDTTIEAEKVEKKKKKSKKPDVSNVDVEEKLNGIENVEKSTEVSLNQSTTKEKDQSDKKKKKSKSKEVSKLNQYNVILQQIKNLLEMKQSNKKPATTNEQKKTSEVEAAKKLVPSTITLNETSNASQVYKKQEKKKKTSKKEKETVNPNNNETKKEEIIGKNINGVADSQGVLEGGSLNESVKSKEESKKENKKKRKKDKEKDQPDKGGSENVLYSTLIEPALSKQMRISFCSPIPQATDNSEASKQQTNPKSNEEKKTESEKKKDRKRKKQNSEDSTPKRIKTSESKSEGEEKEENTSKVQMMMEELRKEMLNNIRQKLNLSSANS